MVVANDLIVFADSQSPHVLREHLSARNSVWQARVKISNILDAKVLSIAGKAMLYVLNYRIDDIVLRQEPGWCKVP